MLSVFFSCLFLWFMASFWSIHWPYLRIRQGSFFNLLLLLHDTLNTMERWREKKCFARHFICAHLFYWNFNWAWSPNTTNVLIIFIGEKKSITRSTAPTLFAHGVWNVDHQWILVRCHLCRVCVNITNTHEKLWFICLLVCLSDCATLLC